MEKENFISLYDFLGKPAGGQLGKEVFEKAKELKEKTYTRDVSNRKYTGKVMLYRREFLNSYFNGK